MAQPNTPMIIPAKAQDGILQFIKSAKQLSAKHWNMREKMRQIDLAYMREVDLLMNMQKHLKL